MKNRVDLMINEDCNIDCVFCYHHGFQDKSKYDFSKIKIKGILFYGKIKGFKEVYISGGEPTISDNLEYSIEVAKKYGYNKIKIMTNGLKFSDLDYCKKLRKLGVTNLAISMHGYDKKTFEFHANVKGIYNKFVKALINSNNFFDIDINIVVTKKNIKTISRHIKLLLTLGIRRVHLQHIVPNSKDNKKLLPSNEEIFVFINDVIEKYEDKIDITLEFFPYCLIKREKYLGRFSYENNFITNNPTMFDNWSNGILKNKILKDKCLKCSEQGYCKGFWI